MGPGTFRPVEVDDVREHRVDPEPFTIPADDRGRRAPRPRRGPPRRRGRHHDHPGPRVRPLGPDGRSRPATARPTSSSSRASASAVVDALVTNFHLPRSSLLLLVSAFAGRERRPRRLRARRSGSGYRFYSYGDAMLIV